MFHKKGKDTGVSIEEVCGHILLVRSDLESVGMRLREQMAPDDFETVDPRIPELMSLLGTAFIVLASQSRVNPMAAMSLREGVQHLAVIAYGVGYAAGKGIWNPAWVTESLTDPLPDENGP